MNQEASVSIYEEILASYKDPYLKQNYIVLNAIKSLTVHERKVQLSLVLPYPCSLVGEGIQHELCVLFAQKGVELEIELIQSIPQFNPRPQTSQLAEVRNIIAIASGKGGVGKSTVSLNIARALLAHGARVGILDADIYGPSQPHLLKVEPQKEKIVMGKNFIPISANGLQSMSLSYLLDSHQAPTIWRGAMASNALQQLLYNSKWDKLDYLIIDLPPGTGDIQLTLCQRVSLSGAVIISTPHELALLGAKKGIEMFRRLYVPVIGIIENMSYYICTECKRVHYIFGKKETAGLAHKMTIPLLAELPITKDSALPISEQGADSQERWKKIALNIALAISTMKVAAPPKIEIVED